MSGASEVLVPTITPLTLVNANTEYSVAFSGIHELTFQCRTAFDCFWAATAGQVAGGGGGTPTGNYATLKAGSGFTFPEKVVFSGTLYFASAQAGVVIELVSYPIPGTANYPATPYTPPAGQ